MRTILVDDEKIMLRQLEMELSDNPKVNIVGTFTLSTRALEYAKVHSVDFAFLDIEMPSMNGIELGKELKKINPDMVIIYISGYSEYIREAILDVKSDYYILKPYNSQDIIDAVERACLLAGRQKNNLYVHTFGRFEVYDKDRVIDFSNAKAKELLALCIDHVGGEVSMDECAAKLWGNRPYDEKVKNLYRKAVSYLKRLLAEYGHEDVFINKRGSCCVAIQHIICDYYQYIIPEQYGNLEYGYSGEYMIQYEWAREKEAKLLELNK